MSNELFPRKPLLAAWAARSAALLALGLIAAAPALAVSGKGAAADPIGDTFGSGPARVDATAFSIADDGDELVIGISLTGPISAPDSGLSDALTGFVDLDVDRDPATGGRAFVDFMTGLASGLGTDFYVPLASYSSDDGRVDLVDDAAGAVGRVPVSFGAAAISIRIPRSLVGPGAVHSAAVVGTLAEVTDAVPNGGFVASDGVLSEEVLLNGGRFRVEVFWRDFQDRTGAGQLAVRSDDSAIFYFFDAANWELMIKVLDGCGLNGHYWVFAAATTDVEYTLTVTDTEAGDVKQYNNPLGTASAAVTDTNAFATCP